MRALRGIVGKEWDARAILALKHFKVFSVSDRLRQDLHTRVIATHLLQRYGYLLPRVNPDSDLAVEHNLEMRARVQELERAAEPREGSQPAPQTVITVGSSK